MIQLFKNYPLFLRFWIATVASQIASRMHSLILIWLVYEWSNSAFIVGVTMIAASLPSVLISPLAGSIADRHNKITLMYIADFIRMITLLVFAYLYFEGILDTTILIIGTIFISISSAFFNPASMSILPQLVKKEDITKANATGQISSSVSSILGPLFGSAMIASLGVTNAFLVAASLFLVSVIFLIGLKEISSDIEKLEISILNDIKNGFSLIKEYEIVSKMISKLVIINFFFSSLVIVAPILADGNATSLAFFMSSLGVGMLFASLFLSSKIITMKPTLFLFLCLLIMGLAFVSLGLSNNFNIYIISMFVIGLALNSFNIITISIYQTSLPQKSLGKIMALVAAVSISLQPISYGIMGVFIEIVGVTFVLVLSGLIVSIGGLQILKIKKLNEEKS
ncbi:MAG: MFS transporter [Campylobacterales bacterium]